MLLIEKLKVVTSINFFPNLSSKSMFSSGAGDYNLCVFCSI